MVWWCVDSLEKISRKQLEIAKLKTGLVSALMETSLRHRYAHR